MGTDWPEGFVTPTFPAEAGLLLGAGPKPKGATELETANDPPRHAFAADHLGYPAVLTQNRGLAGLRH